MYVVDPADVRDVLRHLARDRTPRRTPLADLELVRRQLADAGFPATPEAGIYEIGQLMTQLVEGELRQLRARNEVPAGVRETGSGLGRVLADFRAGDPDLESWSAVYHVYLRPDLRLDLRSLERLLGDRHRRTIQRRLKAGTESLAVRLEALERAAQRATRQERLLTGLPPGSAEPAIGIDALVREVRSRLQRGQGASIVALGGPPGVGKTTVALATVRAMARGSATAEPVWISSPTVCETSDDWLLTEVAARCGLAPGPAERLRADLARESRVVVLDGLDEIASAARAAEAASRMPSSLVVLLAGRVCWSAVPAVRALPVPPLGRAAALQLLRRELARRGLHEAARASDEQLEPITTASGGIPLLLCAAAGELRLVDARSLARAVAVGSGIFAVLAETMWSRQWWSVEEPARQAAELVIAAEARAGCPSRSDLVDAWRGRRDAFDDGLRAAVDAGLLMAAGPAHRLSYSSAHYLARFVDGMVGASQEATVADLSSASARPCP